MEDAFLAVLDPSSVKIAYQMCCISKSTLCRSGVCLRFSTQYLSTYNITENAIAGDQQMIGRRRQIYGYLDTKHSYNCSIVKYYPKLLPMVVYLLPCKKSPNCASGKQRLTMFVAFYLVSRSFLRWRHNAESPVQQPSWRYHPSDNPGSEHAFERTYASAANAPRSSSVAPNAPIHTLRE